MPSCPQGHNSATDDYCDECGARIATTVATSPPSPDTSIETCPVCGVPRSGRFCEEDGYDFVLRPPVTPAPAAPARGTVTVVPEAAIPATPPPARTGLQTTAGLVAVVTADRPYYETVMAQHGPDAASITFPAVYPPRRIPLAGPQMVIGRHSTSRGLNPEIDLTGPPEDPGVSHLHAVLQPHPDGGWTITDPGSTNGTTINDDPRPIEVGVLIPVRPGDRIHVGAWTTITLESTP